jgi:hypothetical protein
MRDLKHNISIEQSISPTMRTTTVTGTAVDRLGYDSATFALHVGTWTDGTFTFGAEHSDDNSDWSTVSSTDLLGTAVVTANDDSPATADLADTTETVGYIGEKRYVRPKVTASGSPAVGAFFGVDVILGHASSRPVS